MWSRLGKRHYIISQDWIIPWIKPLNYSCESYMFVESITTFLKIFICLYSCLYSICQYSCFQNFDEKNFHPGSCKFFFFLINLIEFLNKIYTYRTTLTPLFFVEKQRDLPFIIQREKMSIHTNIFTVNLNSKFYWPVFKIQPLIWT